MKNLHQHKARQTKSLLRSIQNFFADHKWTLLIFFLIAFRAPLMRTVQNNIYPDKKNGRAMKVRLNPSRINNTDQMKMLVSLNGLNTLDDDSDDDDDGCDDGGGGCGSDDGEYYGDDSGSDSGTDGCSDDDGCYEEDDDEYYYGDDSYDDGCSCESSTVVGGGSGGGEPSFFNSELVIRLNLSATNHVSITMVDLNDYPVSVILQNANVQQGRHTFIWSERAYNKVLTTGTYRIRVRLDGPVIAIESKMFTYNLNHGFQVNGSQSNELIFSFSY